MLWKILIVCSIFVAVECALPRNGPPRKAPVRKAPPKLRRGPPRKRRTGPNVAAQNMINRYRLGTGKQMRSFKDQRRRTNGRRRPNGKGRNRMNGASRKFINAYKRGTGTNNRKTPNNKQAPSKKNINTSGLINVARTSWTPSQRCARYPHLCGSLANKKTAPKSQQVAWNGGAMTPSQRCAMYPEVTLCFNSLRS